MFDEVFFEIEELRDRRDLDEMVNKSITIAIIFKNNLDCYQRIIYRAGFIIIIIIIIFIISNSLFLNDCRIKIMNRRILRKAFCSNNAMQ